KTGYDLGNAYPLFDDDELKGAIIIAKDFAHAFQLTQKLSERELYLKEIYRNTFKYTFSDIITENETMKKIIDILSKIAVTEEPILLIGEMGVGKSIISEAIHAASERRNNPF